MGFYITYKLFSPNPGTCLLNILVSGKNSPVAVLELVYFQGNISDCGKNIKPLYVIHLLST